MSREEDLQGRKKQYWGADHWGSLGNRIHTSNLQRRECHEGDLRSDRLGTDLSHLSQSPETQVATYICDNRHQVVKAEALGHKFPDIDTKPDEDGREGDEAGIEVALDESLVAGGFAEVEITAARAGVHVELFGSALNRDEHESERLPADPGGRRGSCGGMRSMLYPLLSSPSLLDRKPLYCEWGPLLSMRRTGSGVDTTQSTLAVGSPVGLPISGACRQTWAGKTAALEVSWIVLCRLPRH